MYIRYRPNGSVELQVKSKLLPRGAYHGTFDTEALAREYGTHLERLLASGHVPPELVAAPARDDGHLGPLIRAFMHSQPMAEWLEDVLTLVRNEVAAVPISSVNYKWAEEWVRSYKLRALVPGTIRKRVSALSRVLDWHSKATEGEFINPLRLLPEGYSGYSALDRKLAGIKHDDDVPADGTRDRRLEANEEKRLHAVMAGEKRDDRQRAIGLPERDAFVLLVHLLLETGMRLSEAFTLTVDQVDLAKRTINLIRTKNGSKRQVPLSSTIVALLRTWLRGRVGRLFPWYVPVPNDRSADRKARKRTSTRLSQQFRSIVDYAGLVDLTLHDLRHEAACRVYERTTMTDVQVARMFGWKDTRMCIRYASLRGSDLAGQLW
jgi:integrase